MRTAICFSGAIRMFERCIPTIQKYVLNVFQEKGDLDIFIHGWLYDGESIDYGFKWKPTNITIEKIVEILKPKRYVIKKYTKENEIDILKETNVDTSKFDTEEKKNYGFNCCGMYYGIKQVYDLMQNYASENNIKYNLIIRSRLDFIWEYSIDITNPLENTIYLVRDRYATHAKVISNDKFFAGNMEVMSRMCDVCHKLVAYQKEGLNIEGQTINEIHIKKNNFNVVWLGNENTYYKCMGRHYINYLDKAVDVVAEGHFDFVNELCYTLFSEGFKVTTTVELANYNKLFEENKNKINKTYKIAINNKIEIGKNTITLTEEIYKNNTKELIEFIISLISYNVENQMYNFEKTEQIKEIEIGEELSYKLLDRGYYRVKLLENIGKNKYKINMANEEKIIVRNMFTINRIYKYYKPNVLVL